MSRIVNLLGKILKPAITLLGRSRLSRHAGTMELKGLIAPVEVRRDPRGVPYIYAQNEKDLFYAQGFVHAQDRLWQMEVNRRLSEGTLAEVFGADAIDTDRVSRTLGFRRIAKEEVKLLPPQFMDLVSAYVSGVNAYIKSERSRLPVEFRLAGYQPALWSVEDVITFTRMMTMRLSIGWGHEIASQKLLDALGEKGAELIGIKYPKGNPVTLPTGNETNALTPDGKFEAMDGPFFKRGTGSNAWAITGSRTDTGKPYLCSDPHLPMLMPAIWYQIYMEGGDFRCQGASIPGLPLVQIGHNSKISWGITLAFTDIQDLFVEEFDPKNPTRYKFRDEWKEARVIKEEIKVKGQKEPFVEKVVMTDHGVIISDVYDVGKRKLALKSPALQPSRITEGWYSLDKAKGWNDFVEALRFLEAPGLNVVYADVEGNIGYWVTGNTPVRAQGKGSVPVPGFTGEHEWTGMVPFEEMPHTLNPERGHVISCNHKIVSDDFPWFMGDVWMNGFRAQRLEELFAAKQGKFSIEDFKKYHLDFQSIPGKQFAALYEGMNHENALVQTAIYTLSQWNGLLDTKSVAGSIYMVTKQFMSKVLFEAKLGEKLWEVLVGRGIDDLLFGISEYQGHDFPLLMELMENPKSDWVVAAGGKEALLKTAIEKAVEWLSAHLGKEVSAWAWGKLHKVEFPHPMAVKKPLDKVFNVGPFPIGGDTDTVCQTAFKPHEPYNADQACPSYRQIVDLNDFNNCQWILPPGQSGQIGSSHYDDQVKPWLKGEYFPMVWDRKRVEEVADQVLELVPFRVRGASVTEA